MLDEKRKNILNALSVKIENIIKKFDKENEEWVQGSELPQDLKKPTISIIEEFEKEIANFFEQQKKAYLKAISEADFSKKPIKKAAETSIEELVEIISQYILVNNEHYVDVLTGIYEAFAIKAILSTAKIIGSTVKDTQIEPEISLTKKAIAWIDKTKIPFSREVQQTTHDRIVFAIKDSLSEHTGSQNVVNSMYQLYIEGKLDDFKKDIKQSIRNSDTFDWNRARTTARTEMMNVTNAGVLEGYRQSKVVKYKKWKCECGNRSRDTHIDADNIVALVDEPFVVGGYQLMHPGDRSLGAPAREIINCRCCMSEVPEALEHKYVPQYNPYKEKDVGTDEWLKRQSKEFQTGYLGSKEKQHLFAEGLIGVSDKDKSLKELSETKYIVLGNKINTKAYTDKFSSVGKNNVVDTKVRNAAVDILKHRNGTPYEDAYYLSERTGKTLFMNNKYDMQFAVRRTEESVKFFDNLDEDIIAIHNHPGSTEPSIDDLKTMLKYPRIKKMVVVGHNGSVYIVSDMDKRITSEILDNLFEQEYNGYISMGYDKNMAYRKAMDMIFDYDLFKYTVR